MNVAIDAVVVALMAVLNRFRGGGFGAADLPGHPRFYVAPVMVAVAWSAGMDVPGAIVFAGCWLAWCWLPWGLLMSLGRWEPQRDISRIETALLSFCRGNIWLAFWLRHAIGLLPTTILVTPWAQLLPPLIVAAYEASWRWAPRPQVIAFPEMATGAAMGALLILAT